MGDQLPSSPGVGSPTSVTLLGLIPCFFHRLPSRRPTPRTRSARAELVSLKSCLRCAWHDRISFLRRRRRAFIHLSIHLPDLFPQQFLLYGRDQIFNQACAFITSNHVQYCSPPFTWRLGPGEIPGLVAGFQLIDREFFHV